MIRCALVFAGLLAVSTAAAAEPQATTPAPAASALPAPAKPEPPPIRMSAAECDVWNREAAFARSAENHDAAAFAQFWNSDAVFIGGPVATRGRAAIAEDWKEIVEGKTLALRWHPRVVLIAAGDPSIALSRGPFWIEDFSSDPHTFRTGNFSSVWKKGSDGVWQVLFDGGGPPSKPATTDEIAKLKASLTDTCPRA
ncbi:MAG: nuclear transport factor 2 family protein [Dokdonella sp.]